MQYIAAFIALCKGILGVRPVFHLFKYFFAVSFVKGKVGNIYQPTPIGCTSIHFRSRGSEVREEEYMPISLTKGNNKGWHSTWFYVKSYEGASLPFYTGQSPVEKELEWARGPKQKEKENLADYIAAIRYLKRRGLTGGCVVGAYHKRRVAPIMVRTLALDEMRPDASLEALVGTVLATKDVSDSEI